MSDVIDSLLAGSLLSRKEESDSAGMSLEKSQEKEPDLISVQFFSVSAWPERSEIPLVEKRERRVNCQS